MYYDTLVYWVCANKCILVSSERQHMYILNLTIVKLLLNILAVNI